jgi:hypothetical protein
MPSKRIRTPSRSSPNLVTWLSLALLVILLDQASKVAILGRFAYGDSVFVTSWFNLVRVHNTGAAFSFLADASGWQRWFFVGLGVGASALFTWMLKSPRRAEAVLLFGDDAAGRCAGQRDRPALARLRGGLPAGARQLAGADLSRRVLPGLQPGRQRHHSWAPSG